MHDDHTHDHGSITHSMGCPVKGCTHKFEVHAHNDDEAVQQIINGAKDHFGEVHPDAQGMTPEEMEQTTKANMTTH